MGWVAMDPGLQHELSSSQACLSLVRGSLSHVHPAAGRGRSQHSVSSSCQTWMSLAGLCWAGIEWTTHGCFHKVPKANHGYSVADGSGLQIKSQANFISCQRSNPDKPLPGVSEGPLSVSSLDHTWGGWPACQRQRTNKVLEKHKESNSSITTSSPADIGVAELETRCKWGRTWEGSGTVWDLKCLMKQGACLQKKNDPVWLVYCKHPNAVQNIQHCPTVPAWTPTLAIWNFPPAQLLGGIWHNSHWNRVLVLRLPSVMRVMSISLNQHGKPSPWSSAQNNQESGHAARIKQHSTISLLRHKPHRSVMACAGTTCSLKCTHILPTSTGQSFRAALHAWITLGLHPPVLSPHHTSPQMSLGDASVHLIPFVSLWLEIPIQSKNHTQLFYLLSITIKLLKSPAPLSHVVSAVSGPGQSVSTAGHCPCHGAKQPIATSIACLH